MSGRKKSPSVEYRFEENFHTEPTSGCWLWTGWLNRKGYGTFRLTTRSNESTTSSNRAAWKIYKGKIPSGLFVLHKCHNASCVNPDHLYLGTHRENMKDMRESGRGNNQYNYRFRKEQGRPKLLAQRR